MFLLSIRTGAVGITLTAASHVYMVSTFLLALGHILSNLYIRVVLYTMHVQPSSLVDTKLRRYYKQFWKLNYCKPDLKWKSIQK